MPSKRSTRGTLRILRTLAGSFLLCVFFLASSAVHGQVSVAWTTRYGANGLLANPVGLASDPAGNAYVTANVLFTGASFHYETLTIKYDSNGVIQWKNWLGSFAHPSLAAAIAVDAEGNVYVLASIGEINDPTNKGNPGNSEYATIKYSSNGARQWIAYLPPSTGGNNRPNNMAVTAAGTVYVTGSTSPASNAEAQVLTAKYATSGELLWTRLSPTAAAGFARPQALALDAAENVYIPTQSTHLDPTIYKFDSAGNPLGAFANKDLDGFNVFYVDALGNSYTAGCTAPGPVAIKLDPNGNEVWKHPFTPTRCFTGIQVDSHGDVALAETVSVQRGASQEIALTKLDVNGNLLWESIVANPGFSAFLSMDAAESLYITGEAAAFKYNAAGQPVWSEGYSDGANFVLFRGATLTTGNRFVITASSIKPDGSESDIITLALSQP